MKALITRIDPTATGGIDFLLGKNTLEETMSCKTVLLALMAAGFPILAAHAAGDAEQGKAIFQKTCGLCHTTEAGKNKIGPSLHGVVGREAGTLPGYSYSEAMKKFHQKWTPEELQHYLTDPRKIVPGTKMIFAGLKDEKQRDDVVAYLETLK
jgi:cytochrome c